MLLLGAFSCEVWKNSGKAQRKSVPRASGLFLNSLSRSVFQKRPEFAVKLSETQKGFLHVCLDSAVPVTSVTTAPSQTPS